MATQSFYYLMKQDHVHTIVSNAVENIRKTECKQKKEIKKREMIDGQTDRVCYRANVCDQNKWVKKRHRKEIHKTL